MVKTIYQFSGTDAAFQDVNSDRSTHQQVDVQRMKAALSGPSIAMPRGLSREEARAFILSHATGAK